MLWGRGLGTGQAQEAFDRHLSTLFKSIVVLVPLLLTLDNSRPHLKLNHLVLFL